MGITEIILIAFALAIDAFAVSFAAGAFFGKASPRQKFRLSFHFGLFQFFMPLIGWLAGAGAVDLIESFDHWVAFIILVAIGTKMIYDSFNPASELMTKDVSKGWQQIAKPVTTP